MTPPTMSDEQSVDTLLSALDTAGDEAAVEQAEGLLGRLLSARAARTRDRLAREANAERLASLQKLREEIVSRAGDADQLVTLLGAAVDSVAELIAAADSRRTLHEGWVQKLAHADIVPNIECLERDAGLGWLESGHDVAVDRRRIRYLTADDFLGMVLMLVNRRTRQTSGSHQRSLTPSDTSSNRELASDPTAFVRKIMAAELGGPAAQS